jgi:hypothetical protein
MNTLDKSVALAAFITLDPAFKTMTLAEQAKRLNALLSDYWTEDGGDSPVWTWTEQWLARKAATS